MATQPNSGTKHGASRGKLILIGVLGVVLVAVVYWNYFRGGGTAASGEVTPSKGRPSDNDAVAASAKKPRTAPARREASPRPAEKATRPEVGQPAETPSTARRDPWPEFELKDVIVHDPFALPEQFPQPAATVAAADGSTATEEELEAARAEAIALELAATLAQIRKDGVELVLQSGKEYVAKIGDKQIRVGDKIGGFTVVDISLQGVTLEGDSSE